jgi:hypothetical protein
MSNYLAVAAVTSTLNQWLFEKAAGVIGGAKTTIGRPKEGTPTGINIYLYQVTYNTDRRNEDLPIRRSDDTTLVQRPKAALDLYYLLTFYGSETELEPQILLGSTISVLHTQPVITRDMLRREIDRRFAASSSDILARYDTSGQIQSIAFTPLSYNTEDFSKLWSMLFQITYTLSIAYKASPVFVEADMTPRRALPVLRRYIDVLPFNRPVIEKVSLPDRDDDYIVYNSCIIISGRNLKGEPTKVSIGEVEVTLDPTDTVNTVTGTQVSLSLNSALFTGKAVRAGIQGVSVLHPLLMGNPKVEHYGSESNVKPLVLSPTITNTSIDGTAKTMTLTIIPKVGKTQKAIAFLNEFEPASNPPNDYVLKAPDNNGVTGTGTETDSITFPLAGVKRGNYLIRIQVDNAESPLTQEMSSLTPPDNPLKFNGPQVIVP